MDKGLPTTGTYVVAVSGGVDSMVLLHLLNQRRTANKGLKLVVAHLDHGIRPDSAEDRKLVQAIAQKYGLFFVYEEANLGPSTSEAAARQARYDFLRRVATKHKAQAIITAHHQDDLLETAIINMLRGSGRKGLVSLKNRPDLLRPLLKVTKKELTAYAQKHHLSWREDITNQNEAYLRNYVRLNLLPRFNPASRRRLLKLIEDLGETDLLIDNLMAEQLQSQSKAGTLDRIWFNNLPHEVAREALATWLRAHNVRGFDSRTLERLAITAKVAEPGKLLPVQKGWHIDVKKDHLALIS